MYKVVASTFAAVALFAIPGQIHGQGQSEVTQEIRQRVQLDYQYTAENLRDRDEGISANGSLEFWSSGGLVQNVPPDAAPRTYEFFNLVPKYIWVVSLSEDVAMAQFYVEGSYQETGQPPVDHYFTRATQVFVKENGEWVVRGAHWSPVAGGSGTQQTAVGG